MSQTVLQLAEKAKETVSLDDIAKAAEAANDAIFDGLEAAEMLFEITLYDRLQAGLEPIEGLTDTLKSALADVADGWEVASA